MVDRGVPYALLETNAGATQFLAEKSRGHRAESMDRDIIAHNTSRFSSSLASLPGALYKLSNR